MALWCGLWHRNEWRGAMAWLLAILLKVEAASLIELGIPLLAEAAYERLFQELIQPHAFQPAECLGSFAYFPAVEINRREPGVLCEP